MTSTELSVSSPDDTVGSMLASVADGDTAAFGMLYDTLALATYAVCRLTGQPDHEASMMKTWLFVWANAASLSDLATPARSVILDIAREMSHTAQPAAR